MRCIGLETGCCNRCAKAKRECVVLPSRRGHQANKSSPSRQRNATVSSKSKGTSQRTSPASLAISDKYEHERHARSSSHSLSRPDSGHINGHDVSHSTHSSTHTGGMLMVLSSPVRSPSKSHTPQSHETSSSRDTSHRSGTNASLSESALEDLVRLYVLHMTMGLLPH